MVSRETKLDEYVALMVRWRTAINLTSRKDSEEHRLRAQIAASQAVVPHISTGVLRLIDLGSGQGFPAVPIAIETGIEINLIEADRRKAAFLTTVLSQLKLAGKVWPVRIEQAAIEPAACITARALAPLTGLVRLARPLLHPNGCCLFLKGSAAEAEVQQMRLTQECEAEIIPLSAAPSCLVKISAIR